MKNLILVLSVVFAAQASKAHDKNQCPDVHGTYKVKDNTQAKEFVAQMRPIENGFSYDIPRMSTTATLADGRLHFINFGIDLPIVASCLNGSLVVVIVIDAGYSNEKQLYFKLTPTDSQGDIAYQVWGSNLTEETEYWIKQP